MPILLPNEEVSRDQLHGYTVFLWAHDHPYPRHIHVKKGRRRSGWNLDTLDCTDKGEFSSSDVREQRKILVEHREALWRSWYAYWEH